MPWTIDDSRIRSLPKPGRELWVRVANGYLEDHPGEDVSAIRIAWSAVASAGYKKEEGEHKWSLSGTNESVAAFTKNIHPFGEAPVTFVKAYTAQDKVRHVVVKASGLKVDRQEERMAPTAIDDMVAAAKAGKAELLDNHFSSFEMGKSTDAYTNDDGEMFVDFALNKTHPNNDQLYKECEQGICKRQASVGGNVTNAHYEYNEALGKAVKVLDHVDLDHVAVTRDRHSAYPDAEFVGAIMKQVHLVAPDFKKGGGTMKEFIQKLEKLATEANELMKGFFQVTADMLDGNFTLKAQYREQLEKAAPKLSPEDKAKVAKSLESILKPLGIPTVVKGSGDGYLTDENLKGLHSSHLAMGHALKAMEDHVSAEGKPIHKEVMDHHEAMGKTIQKMIDSGTGKDAKEEKRPGSKPKDQKNGSEKTEAGGPGSEEEHEGNGSADAEKAMVGAANALMKKLRDDLEAKLKKANEDYETLKKDSHVTTQQLTKSMLEVAELKKDLAKIAKAPAAPRVGVETKVEKTQLPDDVRSVEAILKTVSGDPDGFMSKLEAEVNQLAKMKGTASWTADVQKEATRKAQILKDCKTMGPLAAMAKHGVKVETNA